MMKFDQIQAESLKTQFIVDQEKKTIIGSTFSNSKRHDFRLFKESGVHIYPAIKSLTDTGYQGIQQLHPNGALPRRKLKSIH